jgi:hypothetical protein
MFPRQALNSPHVAKSRSTSSPSESQEMGVSDDLTQGKIDWRIFVTAMMDWADDR